MRRPHSKFPSCSSRSPHSREHGYSFRSAARSAPSACCSSSRVWCAAASLREPLTSRFRSLAHVIALFAASAALTGGMARVPSAHLAVGKIAATAWPYLPGSSLPLRVDGFAAPYHAALLGPGRLSPDGVYEIPQEALDGSALLVAGNTHGLAATSLRIATPPRISRPFLVVASYDDGVIFHDAEDFSVLGVLATGGTP